MELNGSSPPGFLRRHSLRYQHHQYLGLMDGLVVKTLFKAGDSLLNDAMMLIDMNDSQP